jgi:hypothetical protein
MADIEIAVSKGSFEVNCAFCNTRQRHYGELVTGIEWPRSIERVLDGHYSPKGVLWLRTLQCRNLEAWRSGTWAVTGGYTDSGEFTLTEAGPTIDPEIGTDGGQPWKERRVRQLAAEALAGTAFVQRESEVVGNGQDILFRVRTLKGEWAIVAITIDEYDGQRVSDDYIRDKVKRSLIQLEKDEYRGRV